MKLSELWRYEKLFWRRVWRDAWESITKHLGMEGLFASLGFVIGFVGHDQNALSGFVGALATIGAVTVGMIVKSLVTVPTQIHREQSSVIHQLTKDKETLVKDAEPRLEFVFENGKEPFEHTEPALSTGRAIRLFRIAVKNVGSTRLTDCAVKLCDMSNTTNVFLPVELKQRNDNPRAHRVGESPLMRLRLDDFKQTFSVNPNDVEFFDVVGLDERSDVSELTICYARAPYDVPNTIPRGYYVLTVKAFGNVGHDTEIKLAISVEDGILRFNRL